MALLAPGPSTSQASNTQTTTINIKSKKRARFADENHDSNSIENHQQQSLSSFITFNQDDPPLKKIRIHAEPTTIDLLDLSANDTLRKGIYLNFINTAFTEQVNGKFERYDQLLGQFDPLVSPQTTVVDPSPGNVSLTRVQGWLSALTSMVSQLDRGHSHLVEKVLSLPWTVLDDQFVNVYSRFVNGLVSARSEWVQIVLENIVQGFHYSTIPLEHLPTLPSTLWPVLDNYFPKKREHLDGHICYLSNLLRIASYCPDLSAKIVQLCIEKCLKIDVEIQVEVEEWEDEEGRLEEEIFGRSIEDAFDRSWADESDLDDDDDDEDNENGALTDEEDEKNVKAPSAQSVRKVKKLAAKLDGMLRCIFDHLQQISVGVAIKPMSTTTNTGTIESVEQSTDDQIITPVIDPQRQFDREVMFDLLLSNFESAILRTRRTRHVQFIIFWYASLEPTFADSLLATLVERGLYESDDNSLPVATRVAAISYIASLISRAKYIDKHVTRHVVSLLCARLESGLSTTTTSSSSSEVGNSMSVNQHVVWYAIAQAIFYIFCFRWKDLLVEDDDEEEDDDHLGIRFSHPKKFNDHTVVAQFAKISHETNFIYCYDIIRRNNNHQVKETTKKNKNGPTTNSSSSSSSIPSTSTSASTSTSITSASTSTAESTPTCSEPSLSPKHGPITSLVSVVIDNNNNNNNQRNKPSGHYHLPHEQVVNKELFQSKTDLFFPFDPFKLPLSSIYLSSIYRDWESPHDDDDDDEEDDDDDQE
ncbi:hypothetical protein KEM48_007153 [Puccinia striiformis f. sp. tritici PST-130]|nr:hypothetical protein KEM48_007153 [Puccinia striiformis f. sp. tritici PST-130]